MVLDPGNYSASGEDSKYYDYEGDDGEDLILEVGPNTDKQKYKTYFRRMSRFEKPQNAS